MKPFLYKDIVIIVKKKKKKWIVSVGLPFIVRERVYYHMIPPLFFYVLFFILTAFKKKKNIKGKVVNSLTILIFYNFISCSTLTNNKRMKGDTEPFTLSFLLVKKIDQKEWCASFYFFHSTKFFLWTKKISDNKSWSLQEPFRAKNPKSFIKTTFLVTLKTIRCKSV